MTYGVWFPLLAPLLAVPAARRLAEALPARTAAWMLSALAVLLGLSSTAALGLMALAGALRLTFVAAVCHVSVPLLNEDSDVIVPAASAAAALLAAGAVALVRTVGGQYREILGARSAAAAAGARAGAGELSVRRDESPYAFALPGRPGRIVVTTGMLRALTPPEREVLFAHERAHLAGRHHIFLAAGACAATLHPLLRGLREPLAYALERWADECAAQATGDRRLAARAIGRAALAAQTRSAAPRSSRLLLGVTAGPVPRRVAALLRSEPHGACRGRMRRALAAALLVCTALSAASAAEAADDLQVSVEIAQGESAS